MADHGGCERDRPGTEETHRVDGSAAGAVVGAFGAGASLVGVVLHGVRNPDDKMAVVCTADRARLVIGGFTARARIEPENTFVVLTEGEEVPGVFFDRVFVVVFFDRIDEPDGVTLVKPRTVELVVAGAHLPVDFCHGAPRRCIAVAAGKDRKRELVLVLLVCIGQQAGMTADGRHHVGELADPELHADVEEGQQPVVLADKTGQGDKGDQTSDDEHDVVNRDLRKRRNDLVPFERKVADVNDGFLTAHQALEGVKMR